jgi:phage host-nuclease inhibitor protein Gam
MLKITSPEALDSAVADVVRLKINLTQMTAKLEGRLAEIQKAADHEIVQLKEQITAREQEVAAYCEANRPDLFPDKKSRETNLAIYGFEITPPRVETAGRKIKWADVIERLRRLAWGAVYLRTPEPKVDKEAILADRENLSDGKLLSAGIRIVQDEQFFIRPKPETAK